MAVVHDLLMAAYTELGSTIGAIAIKVPVADTILPTNTNDQQEINQ